MQRSDGPDRVAAGPAERDLLPLRQRQTPTLQVPAATRPDTARRGQPTGRPFCDTCPLQRGIGDELTRCHRRPERLVDLRNHPIREPHHNTSDKGCCDHCGTRGPACETWQLGASGMEAGLSIHSSPGLTGNSSQTLGSVIRRTHSAGHASPRTVGPTGPAGTQTSAYQQHLLRFNLERDCARPLAMRSSNSVGDRQRSKQRGVDPHRKVRLVWPGVHRGLSQIIRELTTSCGHSRVWNSAIGGGDGLFTAGESRIRAPLPCQSWIPPSGRCLG